MRIDGALGIHSDPATQIDQYPDGSVRHFVGVVIQAIAAAFVAEPDQEAVELRRCRAGALPAPIFGPDAPVLRYYFEQSGSVIIG